MHTVVLGSAAVNGFLTGSTHIEPVTRPGVPRVFALGICVLAIAALLRTALVIRLAAFHSVIPLLRTVVLVLLTLVLLAVMASLATIGGGQPAQTGTARQPMPSTLPAR
jgi:hypothetical protein